MTITKFKTGSFTKGLIEQVECTRETDKCVYVIGRYGHGDEESRVSKVGSYARFHDTWADAHAHLMKSAMAKVSIARGQLERANAELGNIKGLKQPA